MPYLKDCVLNFLENILVYDERNYDPVSQTILSQKLFVSLTGEKSYSILYLENYWPLFNLLNIKYDSFIFFLLNLD